MILVIFGTHDQTFLRMDNIIKKIGKWYEKEIICLTKGESINKVNYIGNVPIYKFNQLINEAEIVISHAGIGSIIDLSIHRKKVIIVPRRKKFNEHTDDHQMEISNYLKKFNIPIIEEYLEINYNLILKARRLPFTKINEFSNKFLHHILEN